MIRLAVSIVALFAGTSAAAAAPFCHFPQSGSGIVLQFNIGKLTEKEQARFYEMELRARGINASDTRFWNKCIQTFVRENGRTTMRFYDPFTLDEIPVD